MKRYYFLLFFITSVAFSQQEASVWYFGQNAGLKFENSGTVTPLDDGQLNTEEGCSSIADSSGNLLFYTDGRSVWDRNHIAMPNGSLVNGTELFGDGSSTQSGIIVPKPGDPNQYYVFTVDEPHHENAAVYPNAFSGNYVEFESGQVPNDDDGRNNGFNYSIVDLTLSGSNGSIGDLISRNNHLITYDTNPSGEEIKYKCSEKITAIKNEADNSYWVITHFINKFYAFKVTATGVVATPVISTAGSNQSLLGYRRNAIGYLKASPDGTKLAIAHQQKGTVVGTSTLGTGCIELFNFDVATGTVSNAVTVVPNVQGYGVEFSPNSEKLYATYRSGSTVNMELAQLDLTSPNIPASKVVIYNLQNYLFALQLAPNNKIYCATGYANSLGVINNPDLTGLACNYIQVGQSLSLNKKVKLGLPPFITSFFNATFTAENLCFGASTLFALSATQNVTSVIWDFGDSSPLSNLINPTHQYASAGIYQVSATITGPNGVITRSKSITISTIPVIANAVPNITLCDMANSSYNLSQHNNTLLGSQSTSSFGVAYFTSMTNAINHTNLLPISYSLPVGTTTLYAKIYNLSNTNCYAISSFAITLFQKPSATIPVANWICDDSSNDGIGNFNLMDNTATVLGLQNASLFAVSYHLTQNDADTNSNPLPVNFQNSSNPQTIFIRVENKLSVTCYTTASFQIGVYKMPIAHKPPNLYACDSGNDGIEMFNLAMQTPVILGSQSPSDFAISYHISPTDANTGNNNLSTNFTNTVNPQTIYVRVVSIAYPLCFATTSFQVQVKSEPVLVMNDTYAICEGHPITLNAPAGFSSYAWSTGSSNNSATFAIAGNYSLTVTRNYGGITCDTTKNFVVYSSALADVAAIETTEWTDDQNAIVVHLMSDEADYEYSVDGIHFQDSTTFTNLDNGFYTVYVKSKKECGTVTRPVFLLMYPKFFTPNGDGVNDIWRIKFSNKVGAMELHIFDRYGKLITEFNGLYSGWDGTLNGRPLPADDYWFVVKRQNGKECKGHFSLIR